MKYILIVILLISNYLTSLSTDTGPVYSLLERIAPGQSGSFEFVRTPGPERFFEISTGDNGKVRIEGNDNVSLSTGLGWYLRYYTGNHLCWNNMSASLPKELPLPSEPVRHSNPLPYTYYLNYCTHSYSMAFWDDERWQREIDWMALHGINLPLMITGSEAVWQNVMRRLGYSDNEISEFIAGPAFQAWWLMNNLEGWGGPSNQIWIDNRAELQKKNLQRMAELEIMPVLPGYCGMVPHDASAKLGLEVADPGLWCDFIRPAFLQPTDSNFSRIADIYYQELESLYGKVPFYSMDPFHEGGNRNGVDMAQSGKAIHAAMKRANPEGLWIIQAWQENPSSQMIDAVPRGDMIVLDLWSESTPQWGDSISPFRRKNGFDGHQWIQCMLLNYGGNVGLHGKMPHLPKMYERARQSRFADSMVGVGLSMEGIENNPVMYELMTELPWLDTIPDHASWLEGYLKARYNSSNLPSEVTRAWNILAEGIYNCPPESRQQGTTESIFCARPSLDARDASSWVHSTPYYDPLEVIHAADLMAVARENGFGINNDNFNYDYIDITRQANAEQARIMHRHLSQAFRAGDIEKFDYYADRFLSLLTRQDSLLASRPEFTLDRWLEMARKSATDPESADLMERNARLLISTWGGREAADRGGLRDYGNREWSGMLSSLYERRWRLWLRGLREALEDGRREPKPIDWFDVEWDWVTGAE